MAIKLSQGEFIARAIAIHGNKFSYKKTIYVNGRGVIIITCPEHGDFKQQAKAHMIGQGCPECYRVRQKIDKLKSTEQFVLDAIKVHGKKYGYSKTKYLHSKQPVTITCPYHGDFLQKPNSHLSGGGCGKCANNLLKTRDEVIAQFKKKHGDTYIYDRVKYTNTMSSVEIICRQHGLFFQTPKTHLNGHGCKKCYTEAAPALQRSTLDEFITKAERKHGYKYDYSSVDYQGSTKKVKIKCPKHGYFFQTPAAHMRSGCGKCGNELKIPHFRRTSYIKNCISRYSGLSNLYVIRCSNDKESFFKIGITCLTIKTRFKTKKRMPYHVEVVLLINKPADIIWDLEKNIHKKLSKYRYKPEIPFQGDSECFHTIPESTMNQLSEMKS